MAWFGVVAVVGAVWVLCGCGAGLSYIQRFGVWCLVRVRCGAGISYIQALAWCLAWC
jgi:hypothetical protein